jgi:phosphoribosyl-ATP pyrophosphohydrolase/phosphoribosyl-AMP cyclohydrolase
MLAYASREARRRDLRPATHTTTRCTRGELWRKGSYERQHPEGDRKSASDCDGDALLYRVKPRGPACHTARGAAFLPCSPAIEDENSPGSRTHSFQAR